MMNIKYTDNDIEKMASFSTYSELCDYTADDLRVLVIDEDEKHYYVAALVNPKWYSYDLAEVIMKISKKTGKIESRECDCNTGRYRSKGYCVHELFLLRVLIGNKEKFELPFIYNKIGVEALSDFVGINFKNPSEALKNTVNHIIREARKAELLSKIKETKKKLDKEIETQMSLKPVTNYVDTIRIVAYINKVKCCGNHMDDKNVCVEFKIGAEKLYVVKDVYELLDNVKQGNIHKYGKSLEFKHDIDSFEPQSRYFLEKLLESNKNFFRYDNNKRQLYISNLDLFFELYKECKDIFVTSYEFKEEPLKIKADVTKDELDNIGYYEIDIDTSDYIKEKKHLYKMYDNILVQYNHENGQQLLENIEKINGAVVAAEDMEDFMHIYMSDMSDVLEVSGENIFEVFKQDSKICVYADINDYREIEIIVKVKENNQDYNLYDNSYEPKLLKYKIFKQTLLNMCDRVNEENNTLIVDSENVVKFSTNEISKLRSVAEVYVSDRLKRLTQARSLSLNVGVRLDGELLKLNITADDIDSEEIKNILKAYHRKKKYYLLKDGGMIDLESEGLGGLEEIDRQLDLHNCDIIDGEYVMDKTQFLRIEEFDRTLDEVQLLREDSFNALLNNFKTEIQSSSLPEMFDNILRDYQKKGFYWLKKLENMGLSGILADDMGLGKTLQVIALLTSSKSNNNHSLVVCPSSLVYNWESEIKKFNPELKCQKIIGTAAQRAELIQYIDDYDVNIITYDMVKRDVEFLKDKQFHYVILDEAQYIKNSKTKNAISVKKLRANHRLALTGTPIENTLAELWSIFDFLMPGFLFNHHYFQQHYENPIVQGKDELVTKELKRLVEPFILRRRKNEVLKELPEKVDNTYKIDFSDEEWKVYLANLSLVNTELAAALNQTENVNKVIVLAMMTKLRQLCCDPSLIYEEFKEPGSKMLACLDLIETLKDNGKKVLLFSSFTTVLDKIREELDKRNIKSYTIQGSTPKNERQNLVTQFQVDDTPVFLISLRAGGTGLNLTAAEAVIHYDPWWNMSAQNQATDRAHRIGQKNVVNVFKLIMKDSIEERILELQEKKKNLADAFVEDSDGSIAKMNTDEILELFKIPVK